MKRAYRKLDQWCQRQTITNAELCVIAIIVIFVVFLGELVYYREFYDFAVH
jgi:hypothetical protein